MRTAQLGGVVDTAACGETWDQWLTEKLSRTASPVCGKKKQRNRHRVGHQQGEQGSCWGTLASLPVRSQPGSPVRLITISPWDPWPHTTSIITQPALPAAGAPPLTFTKDWKTTTKTTTAEACWQLSYTDIYKLRKTPHALAASRTRIGWQNRGDYWRSDQTKAALLVEHMPLNSWS